MEKSKRQDESFEITELPDELELGMGYDLQKFGEYFDIQETVELKKVAHKLSERGFIEIVEEDEDADVSQTVVIILSKKEQAAAEEPPEKPSQEIPEDEPEAIAKKIIDDIMGHYNSDFSESPSESNVETPAQPIPSQSASPLQSIDEMPVEKILTRLAASIERSQAISDDDKQSLLEKINAINSNPAVRDWLSTPLIELIESSD